MKMKIFLLIISLLMAFGSAEAMLNPATAYCQAMGYEYKDGICVLPDGQQADAWDFLEGKTGKEYSYCEKQGYQLKVVKNADKCIRFLTSECAVCVLENGTQVEVTQLMGLTLKETTCGDGNCGFPEDHEKCPEDCPSGSYDGYCDKIQDGICDLDCASEEEDADCKGMITENTEQIGQIGEPGQSVEQQVVDKQMLEGQGQDDLNTDETEATPGFGLLMAVGAALFVYLKRRN